MSSVIQNVFYGIQIGVDKLTDQQEEDLINCDDFIVTFYNGNAPSGGSGPLLGFQIEVLQSTGSFDVITCVEKLETGKKREEFTELLGKFKGSEIFKSDEFSDLNINDFFAEFDKPSLLIIPETD